MTGVASANNRLAQLASVRRHLTRRTMRVRLALLYGGLFLLSGAALLGVTYVLFERATEYSKPRLPRVPHTPAIQDLHPALQNFLLKSTPGQSVSGPQGQALPQLAQVQHQLAQDQYRLAQAVPKEEALTVHPLPQLMHDQHQLAADQHQLAAAVNQLAAAVHQMARAGSVQSAQRASDSHQLLVNSGIALAVVAVLALLAGWFIAGRMLRPIRTITRKAQRISSANLHERLAVDGPQDELKELGDTLDGLLERLDAAFEAQRQFVANASHELRAPLTRQRALIQVALADPQASLSSLRVAHERVLASEQHLEQMIDALLALTRGQAGIERREHLDLQDLTSQAMLGRESQLAGLDLNMTLAPAPTAGDPRLLERLIANLIDNAIRHNTPGGHVQIATGIKDRHAFVSISNSGPIVPPEEIGRLFGPFQRLSGARMSHNNGHGLGLSIVQAIAGAHRATLITQPRPDGGLSVEVTFPPSTGEESGVRLDAARTKGSGQRVQAPETDASAGG